jgi:Putative Ig domain
MHVTLTRLRKSVHSVASLHFLFVLVIGLLLTARAHAAAPTISGSPLKTAQVGAPYSFQPTASDADGNALVFSALNRPGWASFDSATGRLSGTPTTPYTHSNITIRVSDGTSVTSLPVFSITVSGSSSAAPTISGSPSKSATVGGAYAFQPTATDPSGRALTFSISNKPGWAVFSSATGRLSGTPTAPAMHSNITVSVSNGLAKSSLPVFAISVSGTAQPANHAPTISGTPVAAVNSGSSYSFVPTASDIDGDPLTFSIGNLPSWATFNASSGRLSGTPSAAQIGTYSNVTISVSDGKISRSLPAFSIAVNAVSLGSATLSWTPPNRNTDGSTLTDLQGYRIYYGTNANALDKMIPIANAGITTYVVENLSPATYYFSMTAFNASNVESGRTNLASKVVN